MSCAHSAASCSARLQRIEATGAGSIPTAPTNVYFIINGLREAEGALGGSGLVLQYPKTIHPPELCALRRFELQIKQDEKGAITMVGECSTVDFSGLRMPDRARTLSRGSSGSKAQTGQSRTLRFYIDASLILIVYVRSSLSFNCGSSAYQQVSLRIERVRRKQGTDRP